MIISRARNSVLAGLRIIVRPKTEATSAVRQMSGIYFRSGALKPKPEEMPFGLVAVFCTVIPGLFIGATISKNVANFLEENDLFVPSDDDDDED